MHCTIVLPLLHIVADSRLCTTTRWTVCFGLLVFLACLFHCPPSTTTDVCLVQDNFFARKGVFIQFMQTAEEGCLEPYEAAVCGQDYRD